MAKKRKKPLDVVLPKPAVPEQRKTATPTKQYEQPIGPEQVRKTTEITRGIDPKTGRGYTIENGVRYDDDPRTENIAIRNPETGMVTGVEKPSGQTLLGLSKQDAAKLAPEGTISAEQVGQVEQQLREGQQLAGQAGEFDPLGISPTGLDFGQAALQGAVGSIPSAIRTAGSLAILGAAGGAAGGPVGAIGGAAVGGAVGFVAGITGGMISDLKGQRADTTTAQQRILDEGKQTMKDWASWAEADPANKEKYLAEFNKVASQIHQAYRQMKLDTQQDLVKFETALPNLAEFEAFYAAGGERDELVNDMKVSLTAPANIDNTILQLAYRRGALE